jgi:two-component sensor histidine kinase
LGPQNVYLKVDDIMKNQYLPLMIFALVLAGALFFAWDAYQVIQSQEEKNRLVIKNNAERMSEDFDKRLLAWQEGIKKRPFEELRVKDCLERGDVAISADKPLWPYGEFLEVDQLGPYIVDANSPKHEVIALTTEAYLDQERQADPYLIRLWLEKNPGKFKSIEKIEQLLSLAEKAAEFSQKDSINFVKRTWTFRMSESLPGEFEAVEIWRSLSIPENMFAFDANDKKMLTWHAEDPGKTSFQTTHFGETPYYWAITREGSNYIKKEGGVQGLFLSLLVSVSVLFYGVFFFIRSNNQLRSQAEQREQLVADISHELRTPVTTLRLYSEMLMDGRIKSEEDQQRYLKNMVRESNRLSRLINNVLDFSRMSRGKLKLNIMNISLELFGEDLSDIIEGLDKEKRVRIDFGEDVNFLGDLDGSMQVIYNLINNALKYAPQGEIRVYSEIKGDKLRIVIQDEGAGIGNELKTDLFEPFIRGKDVHKDQIQGSGLGLSVSRSLMETMEGELILENSDKGAKFCASFKLAND